MSTQRDSTLLQDPAYYIMLVVFAVLSTALPALLGQSWFLPIGQSVALTIFVAIAARQRSVKHAIIVMATFLTVQFTLIFLLTLFADRRVEMAISDGFRFRAGMAEWAYGGAALPTSWRLEPLTRLAGVVAMSVGAFLTGGFAGIWVLVRAINLTAYSAAGFLLLPGDSAGLLIGLAPWTLLEVVGGVMLVAVLAQALWTNTWSPNIYLQRHGRTLLISFLLIVLSMVAEFALSSVWRSFFNPPG